MVMVERKGWKEGQRMEEKNARKERKDKMKERRKGKGHTAEKGKKEEINDRKNK